jgi:DNA invertase Pin-like site-specific DNA recombinase
MRKYTDSSKGKSEESYSSSEDEKDEKISSSNKKNEDYGSDEYALEMELDSSFEERQIQKRKKIKLGLERLEEIERLEKVKGAKKAKKTKGLVEMEEQEMQDVEEQEQEQEMQDVEEQEQEQERELTRDEMIQKTKERIGNKAANKTAIIFCRVSTYNQSIKYSVSLEAQEERGQNCARFFGLKVLMTVKTVESGYDGKKCTLKSLIRQYRGKNIIIYDASRFCRNVERGIELLNYALKNKTRLFFCHEGVVWDSSSNYNSRKFLVNRITLAQEESAAIGRRVKAALQEKKRRGFFIGRVAPFGYSIENVEGGKRLVANDSERKVIEFINAARIEGTSIRKLDKLLYNICGYKVPLILEDNKTGEVSKKLGAPLSHENIANILNDYDNSYRGKPWNAISIGAVLKKQNAEKVEEVAGQLQEFVFEFN